MYQTQDSAGPFPLRMPSHPSYRHRVRLHGQGMGLRPPAAAYPQDANIHLPLIHTHLDGVRGVHQRRVRLHTQGGGDALLDGGQEVTHSLVDQQPAQLCAGVPV